MGIPTNYPGLTPAMVNLIKSMGYRLSQRYGYSPDDREDLEQEMAIHLLIAMRRYDPEKSAESTYASRVIRNWTRHLVRKRTALRNNPEAIAYSLDDTLPVEGGERVTMGDAISEADLDPCDCPLGCIDAADLRVDIERIISGLPPKLQEACRALMTQSVAEYWASSGLSRSAVTYRLGQLRKAFMDAGFGENS